MQSMHLIHSTKGKKLMYPLLKKILFQLDPELSHHITLKGLNAAHRLRLLTAYQQISQPCNVMGLTFANPIGLAAGLDKNADYVDALAALGFGFIEIGTITPRPQSGNEKPRLFRLTKEEAIINRMGFNNKGIDYVIKQLEKTRYQGILGINIGKNKETPLEKAIDDYLQGFLSFHSFASYITINISSPNTTGLRELQHQQFLFHLLASLKQAQHKKFLETQKYVPLVVKIAPDLNEKELGIIAETFLSAKIDGVIATNTTIARHQLPAKWTQESGGLSGSPLSQQSTSIIKQLHQLLRNNIPIIASGGVMSKADYQAKKAAGAQLVQVYSGLIYQGPQLINQLLTFS
jgi:dihydroorotate dehydrogenase